MARRIMTKGDLISLAVELGVRSDWHEPDEQEVEAVVRGRSFDNAGFWPNPDRTYEEIYITLYRGGIAMAEINLATLFAWATGLED